MADNAPATVVAVAPTEEVATFHCDYCHKKLAGVLRIKCAVCTDFDLCTQCFSVGVEVSPHSNDHGYQVMTPVNFPLFHEDWEADEELLLVEGMQKYGLGNWADVADHVGGGKTKEECAEHYYNFYIKDRPNLLPDTSNLLTTPETLESRKAEAERRNAARRFQRKKKKKDVKPSSNAHTSSSKTLPGQRRSGGGAASAYASGPVNNDQAGFMPRRQEFDVEYHNDAETIVAPLVFTDEDTPEEIEEKFRVLEVYNARLKERYEKREFAIKCGLMDLKKMEKRERKMQPQDRQLLHQLRPYLQVLTPEDFDLFVDGLVSERSIRRRIEQLQRWRGAGCRTFSDGDMYENSRKRRELSHEQAAREVRQKTSGRVFERFQFKVPKASGGRTDLLDLKLLPDSHLLSGEERRLCSSLRLYPRQYLFIKDTLLRESFKNHKLERNSASQLFKLNSAIVGAVYDFMHGNNWV